MSQSAQFAQSDKAGVTPSHDFELLERQERSAGIMKEIKVKQWSA